MFNWKLISPFLICLVSLIILKGCDLHQPSPPAVPFEQFEPAGLDGIAVNSFEREAGVLYAATDDGVWSTALAEDIPEWTREGLNGLNVADLVVLPDGSILAGIERDQAQSEDPTIYRMDTFAEEWEPYQQDYGSEENYNMVQVLQRHPERTDHIFARGAYHMARSMNSGDSWEVVFRDWSEMGFQADLLAFDPHISDQVWIGGESAAFQPYLYYSDDLGQSWQEVELETGGDDAVYSIAFHPEEEGHLLLGMEGKILVTDDKGDTWNEAFENDDYHYILTMANPNDEPSETVYASGTENGTQLGNLFFLYTEDFGESWEKTEAEQQLQNMAIQDMEIRQIGNETTLYLGTTDGVWIYRK